MLLLMRKPGQVIHIGDDITVKVVSVEGKQVQIGIEAPRDVQILRPEAKVQTRKQRGYA